MSKFMKRSKFGWLDCVIGVFLAALGVYTFINPQIALPGIVLIYSIGAIINGIGDIAFYIRLKSNTGFGSAISLAMGILSALAGVLLLLNPLLGRGIFYIVFPIWFIAHSISRLANFKFIKKIAGGVVSIISIVINSAAILLGVLMIFNPLLSGLSIGYLVAFALVLHGIGNVVEAFSPIGEE